MCVFSCKLHRLWSKISRHLSPSQSGAFGRWEGWEGWEGWGWMGPRRSRPPWLSSSRHWKSAKQRWGRRLRWSFLLIGIPIDKRDLVGFDAKFFTVWKECLWHPSNLLRWLPRLTQCQVEQEISQKLAGLDASFAQASSVVKDHGMCFFMTYLNSDLQTNTNLIFSSLSSLLLGSWDKELFLWPLACTHCGGHQITVYLLNWIFQPTHQSWCGSLLLQVSASSWGSKVALNLGRGKR